MRTSILPCLLIVSLACGAEQSEEATPEPSTTGPTLGVPEMPAAETPQTNEPEVETPYAIHEWGFIAHHYADDESRPLNTGAVPAPEDHSSGRGGGKPVIYVHLQGAGNIARFNASVSTTGRFLEEWPHSEDGTRTRLTWDVEARRGSCSAAGEYPVAADDHCGGIVDHYCEAAELDHYETEDSACLTVAGNEWNHLFYRAQFRGEVPLRVSKRGNRFRVRNSAALPGRLLRIHRQDDASGTRVALFDAPAAGASRVLPAPDRPAAAGITALRGELAALGMSEDEADAFMTAWQPELFGDTPERARVEMVGTPPRALRPKADALLYFLPLATLDAMVPLAFTPPPAEVRRAVLVRIDLGEAYVPPRGTSLGSIASLHPEGIGGPGAAVFQGPIARVVRFRTGSVVVEGGRDRATVRLAIRRDRLALVACGEEHLSNGTEARAEVHFVIPATGAAEDVSVGGVSTELSARVRAVVDQWRFPRVESGTTTVSVPIIFRFA